MKIKEAIVLGCLTAMVVLAMCFEASLAKSEADKPSLKIGVVSIRKIFQDCKRSARYRDEAVAERERAEAELARLAKEIEFEEAGLKTLKTGSSDYVAQFKEILQKQAGFQAEKEFYNRKMALKEQRMVEELYQDILRETTAIAKQKGLDLVFEKSEPKLPASSADELQQAMETHKLLYSGGCLDITDEVMARVDAEEGEKQKTKGGKP